MDSAFVMFLTDYLMLCTFEYLNALLVVTILMKTISFGVLATKSHEIVVVINIKRRTMPTSYIPQILMYDRLYDIVFR